jgi:hypothetical protein
LNLIAIERFHPMISSNILLNFLSNFFFIAFERKIAQKKLRGSIRILLYFTAVHFSIIEPKGTLCLRVKVHTILTLKMLVNSYDLKLEAIHPALHGKEVKVAVPIEHLVLPWEVSDATILYGPL